MEQVLGDWHRPVVDYLCDTGLRSGITVPIRNADGALATFTAISTTPLDDRVLEDALLEVGYLAHVLHDAVQAGVLGRRLHHAACAADAAGKALSQPVQPWSDGKTDCLRDRQVHSDGHPAPDDGDEKSSAHATVSRHWRARRRITTCSILRQYAALIKNYKIR